MSETAVKVGQRWELSGPRIKTEICTVQELYGSRVEFVDGGWEWAEALLAGQSDAGYRWRLLSDAPDQKTERDWSRWLPPADTEDCGIPMAIGQVRAWRAGGRAIVFRVTVANPMGGGSEVLAGSDPIDKPGCSRGWTGGAGVLICNPGEEPRSPEELYGVAVSKDSPGATSPAVRARTEAGSKAGTMASPPVETKPAPKKHDFSNPYCGSMFTTGEFVPRCVDCGLLKYKQSERPCTPQPGWREEYEAGIAKNTQPPCEPATTRVPRQLNYSTTSLEAIMGELHERSGLCPPRGRR